MINAAMSYQETKLLTSAQRHSLLFKFWNYSHSPKTKQVFHQQDQKMGS